MKTLRSLGVITAAVAVASCGSSSKDGGGGAGGQGTSIELALDASGAVQETATLRDASGCALTAFAGARVLVDGAAPPTGKVELLLSVAGEPPVLPAGVTPMTRVRVALRVDGAARAARFAAPEASLPRPGTRDAGLKLTIPADPTWRDGTLGLLFELSGADPVRVGAAPVEEAPAQATSGLAAGQKGLDGPDPQMEFNVDGTGDYGAGGAQPPPAPPASGGFTNTYVVPDQPCIDVEGAQVCGPWRVERASIYEESTGEFIGLCSFGAADVVATAMYPPGYQYVCTRGAGQVVISSHEVANVPLLQVDLVRASDGLPAWSLYQHASGGGDPYEQPDLKFAVYKKLSFQAEGKAYDWMKKHALQPIRDAGYEAEMPSFSTGHAEVAVYDTLVARVKMQQDVLQKEGWRVTEAHGNVGSYEFRQPRYRGHAHARMELPTVQALIWEIDADVTFEKNEARSDDDHDVYDTADGTLTQTSYTMPTGAGVCVGVPESFTDTYPILVGDGYLVIESGSDPENYQVTASISPNTPLESHAYQVCCSYREPPCEDETLEPGEQEHEWLWSGDSPRAAVASGVLAGSQQRPYSASYDWELTREDEP